MGKSKDILEWTRTLTLLLSSGLNIQEAVGLTKSIHGESFLASILERIEAKLTKGIGFSQCLREEPHFPGLYAELVGIGEKTGSLTMVFQQLSDYLGGNRKIREKLKSALIYPAILLILITVGTGGLVFIFIPRLQENLSFNPDVAAELNMSIYKGKMILVIFLFVLALILFLLLFIRLVVSKGSGLALRLHHLMLSFPLLGGILVKNDMYNLFFSLSLLTRCQIPLEESLRMSTMVVSNLYLRDRIIQIRRCLIQGDVLSRLFRREKIFPVQISQWIGVGEKIGKMSEVFSQLEVYYGQEMENISERIMALIEPVTSLAIGLILLVVVVTLIVPLMTIYGGLI